MTGPQAPPGKERRPADNRAADEQTGGGKSLDASVTLTADELAQHAELMFDLGATYMAMQCLELDGSMRDALREVWKSPTWAELEQRRQPTDEPCQVRTCRGCARCIRADAVKRGAVRS